MTAPSRFYSSVAGRMSLVGGVTASSPTFSLDVVVGLPAVPFTLLVDPGLVTEEVVECTLLGGATASVTRGVDGTSAQAHLAGAEVRHAYSARDFQESRNHEVATTAHGVDFTTLPAVYALKTDLVTRETFTYTGSLLVGSGGFRVFNNEGRTLTIQPVRVNVNTPPLGAALVVDVHKNGATIFTTQANRPSVAAGAGTAVSGAPEVPWANGEFLTVDVDQVGSTVAGANMTVQVRAA